MKSDSGQGILTRWLKLLSVFLGALVLLVILRDRLAYYEQLKGGRPIIEGITAPDFELPTATGDRIKLSRAGGRAIILFFFSPECSSCIDQAPYWSALKADAKEDDVFLFGICRSSPDAIESFYSITHVRFPILMDDGDVIGKYDVKQLPKVVLVDHEGRVVFTNDNLPIDESLRIVRNKLEKLFASGL